MQLKSLAMIVFAAGSLMAAPFLSADEAQAPKEGGKRMQRQMRGPGGPGGFGEFGGMRAQRNPAMMTARLVMKELKAYQAKPTPENYAALEKALNEAIKADTAKRKERLEKELADLEKNQAARVRDLLDKVKSGEFKMPERRRMPPPVKERKK